MRAVVTYDGITYNQFPKYLIQNTFGFDLIFNIKHDDGTAFDLTGKTIFLNVKTPISTTKKINSNCPIISAVAGTCKYTFISTDLDTLGAYEVELEVFETGVSDQVVKLGMFGIKLNL